MAAITVITEDSAYELEATGWTVDDHKQLDVTDSGTQAVVASFAPTKWIGVYQNEALKPDA